MACEKCWGDAYMRSQAEPSKSQAEHYRDLLEERKDNPCSPDEQKRGSRLYRDADGQAETAGNPAQEIFPGQEHRGPLSRYEPEGE
jgi:hypothetical protein